MKNKGIKRLLVLAGLLFPLVVVSARNTPLEKVEASGEELARFTVVAPASDQEFLLTEILDRVLKVSLRNDWNPGKNRDLAPSEWTYARGVLKIQNKEEAPDIHRAFLHNSHYIVEGVIKKPFTYRLVGFSGEDGDFYLSLDGKRRAESGLDYTWNPEAKEVTLNVDLKVGKVFLSYWDDRILDFNQWVYGGPEFDYAHQMATDNPQLSTEILEFRKNYSLNHPQREVFALAEADTEHPKVYRKPLEPRDLSGERLVGRMETRTLEASVARTGQNPGFQISAPQKVLDFNLQNREMTERRIGERIFRWGTFTYYNADSRIILESSPVADYIPDQERVYLSSTEREIRGVKVKKQEYWTLWTKRVIPYPQAYKVTQYTWVVGDTLWGTQTHELLTRPYRDMEGFISAFLDLGKN